jgi:DNA-binding IclR family transcriptional regulator
MVVRYTVLWSNSMASPDSDRSSGIQSLERGVQVLRAVAELKRNGARLADIVERTGLSKTTAYRILQTLVTTGFIDQEESTGLFYLGLDLVSLALMAANRHGLIDLISPCMERLAERTGDTVYFNIRNRYAAICVERVEGSFPIRTLTLNRGDRRPLGVGAGNLAMLAFLPDDEVRDIVDHNSAEIATFGNLDAASVLDLVAQTRLQGYAFNDGRIIVGMSAVGVPVMGSDHTPVAALSVAAVTERMRSERRSNIVAWLTSEATLVEEQLRRVVGEITGPSVNGLLRRRAKRA